MKKQNDTINNTDEIIQLKKLLNECKKYSKKLEILSIKDTLTNLYNRRHFDDVFHREIQRADRAKKILSFAIIDVDNLKKYNDCNGHEEGDEVLKSFGSILKKSKRISDVIGRIGGEEFAFILPNTDKYGAIEFANNLRKTIKEQSLEYTNNEIKYTVSIGVSIFNTSNLVSLNELIKQSDEALYKAKHSGKDCAILYEC